MKKRIIIAAAIAVCLGLCAAVWTQAETVEETPALSHTPAVSAPEPIVAEAKFETEIDLPPEKEKATTPQPEPAPVEASAAPKARPMSESEHVPEPTPVSALAQTVTDLQLGDMVYVEGFGWLEYQGPNHCEYAEDIYENGNKIGIMG